MPESQLLRSRKKLGKNLRDASDDASSEMVSVEGWLSIIQGKPGEKAECNAKLHSQWQQGHGDMTQI